MPVKFPGKEWKEEARTLVKEGKASPLLVSAVYLGIVLVLEVLSYLLSQSVFVSILSSLFPMVLSAGMVLFCMGLRRRETMPLSTLFDGFRFTGKVLGVQILKGLLFFAATMAGCMVASLFLSLLGSLLWGDAFTEMMTASVALLQEAELLTPELVAQIRPALMLSLVTLLLGSIPAVVISYRYRFAMYILCRTPEAKVLSCLRLSHSQTEGVKKQLFLLDLSFFGWGLLSLVTFGLLLLWVVPYYTIVNLSAYEYCVQQSGSDPVPEDPSQKIDSL